VFRESGAVAGGDGVVVGTRAELLGSEGRHFGRCLDQGVGAEWCSNCIRGKVASTT
jgi:hypothetical protein